MKILSRIRAFLLLVIGGIQRESKKLIEPAILLTQTIKVLVDSPALDVSVTLSKTPIDDKVLKKLRGLLPDVINKLNLIGDTTNKKPLELIKELIEALRLLSPDTRSALYFKITSLLVQSLDKSIKEAERDLLVQLIYTNLKEQDNLNPTIEPSAEAQTEETEEEAEQETV